MPSKPELQYAFQDGVTLKVGTLYTFRLETVRIDSLVVTSGKLIACDPHTLFDPKPFEQEIPIGSHSVFLTFVHDDQRTDKRVAFARLQLQPYKVPVRWQNAILPGQYLSTLEEDTFFGYGVDMGEGCFMDADAVSKWEILTEQEFAVISAELRGEQVELDPISKLFFQSTKQGWWSMTLNIETGLNVVVFHSGWGDGSYPSFWGYDEHGEVVCLVTDFYMLDRATLLD